MFVFSAEDEVLALPKTYNERGLKRNIRSTRNRVHSILHDSEWINEVREAYDLPLIPNERCGLWYVDPKHITETSYFKSTDGHTNQWSFSTRRLNFHLLDIMTQHNGIIIVDSTRRGKTMPDALSKTIPIWCAVLNYIMHGESENNWCFAPPQIISKNEWNSMIKLIPQFAREVEQLGLITKETLMAKFKGKYIRPLWVYPGLSLPVEPPVFDEFVPIVNCVASFRADDGSKIIKKQFVPDPKFPEDVRVTEFVYVQGAADDHELWAYNLTPALLWEYKDDLNALLKSGDDDELVSYIEGLKITSDFEQPVEDVVPLTRDLSIGKVVKDITEEYLKESDFNSIILLSKDFKLANPEGSEKFLHRVELKCDKKGSNDLRRHLSTLSKFFKGNTLVLCETGTDLSVGIALLYLSTRYNLEWIPVEEPQLVTKTVIKKHLAKILEKKKVNPSRATLQSINSFLM